MNWEPHGSDAGAVAQMWRARWPGESKSGYLRSVSVLDPDAEAWAPGVPLSEERHRGAAAAAAGRIYVAGGFGDDGMLRSVESWAPGEVDWREARAHHLQVSEQAPLRWWWWGKTVPRTCICPSDVCAANALTGACPPDSAPLAFAVCAGREAVRAWRRLRRRPLGAGAPLESEPIFARENRPIKSCHVKSCWAWVGSHARFGVVFDHV